MYNRRKASFRCIPCCRIRLQRLAVIPAFEGASLASAPFCASIPYSWYCSTVDFWEYTQENDPKGLLCHLDAQSDLLRLRHC